jgi:Zn-dependent protease
MVESDTPGSLRFRVFGFPVAINWSVLFVGALIATGRLPIAAIVLFFPAAIMSILIHELGHAAVARSLGARVHSVFLYLMGGLTSWSPGSRIITRSNRLVIAAAGSTVQIVVGLAVFLLMRAGTLGEIAANLMSNPFQRTFWLAGYAGEYLAYTAGVFVWISVFWGVLNLLPIGGLDGSTVVRELAVMRNPARGEEIARMISIVVSVLAFLYLYTNGYRLFSFFIIIWALPALTNRSY